MTSPRLQLFDPPLRMSASSSRQPPKRSRDDEGDSDGGGGAARATRSRMYEGGSLFQVPDDSESDEEPDTEEDDPEIVHALAVRAPPAPEAAPRAQADESDAEPDTESDGDVPLSGLVPRASGSVVDLSRYESPPRARPPTRVTASRQAGPVATTSREGVSAFVLSDSDDDDDPKPSPRDKGKGKARASPRPLTPPPEATAPSAKENLGPSLSTLSCPICLGAPTPLALTSCGHAFCAPCLHAALLAGGPPTPPPSAGLSGPQSFFHRGRGSLFGPGSSRGARTGARGGGAVGRGRPQDDEEESELDGHCPVCRTVLRGGWGRSIRGVTMRMVPVKTPDMPQLELD